ncbi:MAG TPA: exodeoxyribonuclease VII small subunit [Capsulimonadaceae bacterium]|jgi:exodeoxyribonuclease VII small subunit
MSETKIKYDDAIVELEAMVKRFERAEIGVDDLVSQIQRAGVLIKTCRQRLKTVETEVEAALADLDTESTEDLFAEDTIDEPVLAPPSAPVAAAPAPAPPKPAPAKKIAAARQPDPVNDEEDPFEADPPRPSISAKPSKGETGGLFGL